MAKSEAINLPVVKVSHDSASHTLYTPEAGKDARLSQESLLHGTRLQMQRQSQYKPSLNESLFSALLSLGLDVQAIEASEGVILTAASMSLLSKRVADKVLHLLFCCIDRDRATRTFRDCWPLFNKKMEAQFYRAAFDWYKALVQQSGGSSSAGRGKSMKSQQPLVTSRSVITPGSSKFSSTLMVLAGLAMTASIQRSSGVGDASSSGASLLQPPTAACSSSRACAAKVLTANTLLQREQFVKQQQLQQAQATALNDKAKQLIRDYRCEVKEQQQLQAELLQQQQRSREQSTRTLQQQQQDTEAALQSLNDDVSSQWEAIEAIRKAETESYALMEPLVKATVGLSYISASELNPVLSREAMRLLVAAGHKIPGFYSGSPGSKELQLLPLLRTARSSLQLLAAAAADKQQQSTAAAAATNSEEHEVSINCSQQRASSLTLCVEEISAEVAAWVPQLQDSVSEVRTRKNLWAEGGVVEITGAEPTLGLWPPTPPMRLTEPLSSNNVPRAFRPLHWTPEMIRESEILCERKREQLRQPDTVATLSSSLKLFNVMEETPKPQKTPSMSSTMSTEEKRTSWSPPSPLSLDPELLTMDKRALHQRTRQQLGGGGDGGSAAKPTLTSRKYRATSRLPSAAISSSSSNKTISNNKKENLRDYVTTTSVTKKQQQQASTGSVARSKNTPSTRISIYNESSNINNGDKCGSNTTTTTTAAAATTVLDPRKAKEADEALTKLAASVLEGLDDTLKPSNNNYETSSKSIVSSAGPHDALLASDTIFEEDSETVWDVICRCMTPPSVAAAIAATAAGDTGNAAVWQTSNEQSRLFASPLLKKNAPNIGGGYMQDGDKKPQDVRCDTRIGASSYENILNKQNNIKIAQDAFVETSANLEVNSQQEADIFDYSLFPTPNKPSNTCSSINEVKTPGSLVQNLPRLNKSVDVPLNIDVGGNGAVCSGEFPKQPGIKNVPSFDVVDNLMSTTPASLDDDDNIDDNKAEISEFLLATPFRTFVSRLEDTPMGRGADAAGASTTSDAGLKDNKDKGDMLRFINEMCSTTENSALRSPLISSSLSLFNKNELVPGLQRSVFSSYDEAEHSNSSNVKLSSRVEKCKEAAGDILQSAQKTLSSDSPLLKEGNSTASVATNLSKYSPFDSSTRNKSCQSTTHDSETLTKRKLKCPVNLDTLIGNEVEPQQQQHSLNSDQSLHYGISTRETNLKSKLDTDEAFSLNIFEDNSKSDAMVGETKDKGKSYASNNSSSMSWFDLFTEENSLLLEQLSSPNNKKSSTSGSVFLNDGNQGDFNCKLSGGISSLNEDNDEDSSRTMNEDKGRVCSTTVNSGNLNTMTNKDGSMKDYSSSLYKEELSKTRTTLGNKKVVRRSAGVAIVLPSIEEDVLEKTDPYSNLDDFLKRFEDRFPQSELIDSEHIPSSRPVNCNEPTELIKELEVKDKETTRNLLKQSPHSLDLKYPPEEQQINVPRESESDLLNCEEKDKEFNLVYLDPKIEKYSAKVLEEDADCVGFASESNECKKGGHIQLWDVKLDNSEQSRHRGTLHQNLEKAHSLEQDQPIDKTYALEKHPPLDNPQALENEQNLEDEEEYFLDGALAVDFLGLSEPPPSEYLPRDSLFSSLTESILAGETDSSVLQDSSVRLQVARESLCLSHRLSIERYSPAAANNASNSTTNSPRVLTTESFTPGSQDGVWEEDSKLYLNTGRRRSGGRRRISQLFSDYEARLSDHHSRRLSDHHASVVGIMDMSDSVLLNRSID